MARRLVWMPVFPRVIVSAAANLRESAGIAKARRANAEEWSQAPPAAQAVRWRNSRRFMGPPGMACRGWLAGCLLYRRAGEMFGYQWRKGMGTQVAFRVGRFSGRRCLSLTIYLWAEYICRTSRRRDADREIGLAAGNLGHADLENCRAGAGARLRDLAAHPADFQGSAASATGVALPRSASPGKTRVACRRVGRIRQRQPSQVL